MLPVRMSEQEIIPNAPRIVTLRRQRGRMLRTTRPLKVPVMLLLGIVLITLPLFSEAWSTTTTTTTTTHQYHHRQQWSGRRIRRTCPLAASSIDEELQTTAEILTRDDGPNGSSDVIRVLNNGTDRGHAFQYNRHTNHQQNQHQHQHNTKHHHQHQFHTDETTAPTSNLEKEDGFLETTTVMKDRHDDSTEQLNLTTRSLWRRRHARSITEGIRREKASTQLSSLLKKAHDETIGANRRRLIARTITGFISAVAEEADGLEVGVSARKDSPIWEKEIDEIQINFSRLGFRPLRLGGLNDAIHTLENSIQKNSKKKATAALSSSSSVSTTSSGSSSHTKKASPSSSSLSEDLEMTDVSCMNEAFERIDADNSGTLDRDEIAMALDVVTASDSDEKMLTVLASELVELYDTNGDGVVDFDEYQLMVEDMAALRQVQIDRKAAEQESGEGSNSNNSASSSSSIEQKDAPSKGAGRWFSFWRGGDSPATPLPEKEATIEMAEALATPSPEYSVIEDSSDEKPPIKGTGTITLTDLKLDLRRLLFGFLPFFKKITPGGPLVLEPFTATVHGSFSEEDLAQSFLLDDGLRRLVARALRRRVRSVRDLMDGAHFYGRSWNMASVRAPVVEVPELTEITFDRQNRLLITGRVLIQTSPDAPIIENAFKVRTKLGTRKSGQVIRLEQPELALVLECPQAWERNIASVCNKFNWTVPTKPDPMYSFFPIYSPFKVEDNDGFDLGPDNCIKSIFIQDGALRFEMQAILRPGRFLGSHYVAFTLPMRTFLITLDRVLSGIKTARKNKREAQRNKAEEARQSYGDIVAQSLSSQELIHHKEDLKFTEKLRNNGVPVPLPLSQKKVGPSSSSFKPTKSFFSRFVEGYLGVGKNEEVRNERLTAAISEWFGRQGRNNSKEDRGDNARQEKKRK